MKLIYDVPTRWNSFFEMTERFVYLRKAIEMYVHAHIQFAKYRLSKSEWERVEFLIKILKPFKKCSDRMESTKRPGIEKTFWIYETLFNELDKLDDMLNDFKEFDKEWNSELEPALDKMKSKLNIYYGNTARSFIYADACMLAPRNKLQLFRQPSWTLNYLEDYKEKCRNRYINNYENVEPDSQISIIEQKTSRDILLNEDDEYEMLLSTLAQDEDNEFDHYINSPPTLAKESVLYSWKYLQNTYPRLSKMIRDVMAVPATGAGVERQFSKSGRVATSLRARLDPVTVSEIMMYKDHLEREAKGLTFWNENSMIGIGDKESLNEGEVPEEWADGWYTKSSQGNKRRKM